MSLQPQGEDLRRATKWISEQRTENPDTPLAKLVEQACLQFDLSPSDGEFLFRCFCEQP